LFSGKQVHGVPSVSWVQEEVVTALVGLISLGTEQLHILKLASATGRFQIPTFLAWAFSHRSATPESPAHPVTASAPGALQ
jgi:hypothetical protein